MPSSDASPAYRGYRLQALYTLHRLLESQADAAATFQPEGAEDLAVFGADSELQEVIQVKALTHDLVLSDFNPQKPDSFFYRIQQYLASTPQARMRITSFGPIGPELDGALGGDAATRRRVAAKLSGYSRLSEAEAEALLARIELVPAREVTLREAVDLAVRNCCTGIDPVATFSLMTAWLYDCAEHRRKITQQDILAKIDTIGQFLADCAAHKREWFTTIVPITEMSIGDERTRGLGEEYYQGIAARYDHIVAGLDVVRPAKLQQLAQAFDECHVAVVHGASGQGKSTLAYRYLHEYFPEHCRYQVLRIESVTHALSVASALLGHVEAMGVPLAIYLDVAPSDIGWDELVRRLGHHEQIRLLITMREEDWRRATISPTEVRIAQVPLSFDEAEARGLYAELSKYRQPMHVLTFEDAWAEFGGQGPLLEFVYLLTQGRVLRDRLRQQIQRLQDETRLGELAEAELTLLRLVSVAGATGARMHAGRLARYLQLGAPARTLELFEQEYLLRLSMDGVSVGPLHPVRSTILAELLSDPVFAPIQQGAVDCLPLLLEEDVERFMLGVFVHKDDAASTLARRASSWRPERWMAIGGVARALLWLGLAEYVEENHEVLRDAFGEVGGGAIWLLDFDVAGSLPDGTQALLDTLAPLTSPEWKQRTAALRARQTPPRRVFDRLAAYLADRAQPPLPPSTESDWSAVAEVVFWLGHLGITWPLAQWLPKSLLDGAVESLGLETLADVVLGLFAGYGEEFAACLVSLRERMVARFRAETLSVAVEDDGKKVTAHYLVEADPIQVPQSGGSHLRIQDPRNPLHNTAMQHISLLRRLFPDREAYACQGYGHRVVAWELPSDDTRKTGIPRSRLHPYWQTSLNATFCGLAKWLVRPSQWDDYAQAILQLRHAVLTSLAELERGLDVYFRRQHQVRILGELVNEEAWDRCRMLLRTESSLPRAAVDPWGFVDEDAVSPARENLGENSAMPKRKALALQEYAPLLAAKNAYTLGLRNLFDQAIGVLSINPVLGREAKDSTQRRTVLERAEQLGLKPHDAPRLSAFNCVNALQALNAFQREFHHRFAHLVPGNELAHLEGEEQRVLAAVWELWYMFAYHPGQVVQQAGPYCHEQLTTLRAKAKRRVEQEVRSLSSPLPGEREVQARIRSEVITWGDDLTLWITVDGALPGDAYGSLQRIIEAIRRALMAEKEEELRRYLLTLSWPQIAIVPLVRGRSLNANAWCIPSAAFLNAQGVGGINAWNLVQQEIPPTSLAPLGISNWELPRMRETLTLLNTVYTLSFIAAHLRDVTHVPELDDQGAGDMQRYLRRIEPHLSDMLQSVFDAERTLLTALLPDTMSAHEGTAYLVEAYGMLVGLHEMILPSTDFQGQNELTLKAVAEWANRLEKAREQSFLIYLAVASAVLEEQGSSMMNIDGSHRKKALSKEKSRRKHRRR